MIAFLKGSLYSISPEGVVVEVNGVGYLVQVPVSLLSGLPSLGSQIHLHTHMVVKEDGISIYGFIAMEYLNSFRLLLNVNGIGPKGALNILSVVTPGGLAAAVSEENINLLSKAPGVGKKTAQRIVLELKDKFKKGNYLETEFFQNTPSGLNNDALEALISLGFDSSRAALSVAKAAGALGPQASVSEVVRQALKGLADK
ncbi:MAG: Holliday junction branch migration protein RuvA [Peptococcaceae bacterium]|nr:Holliday junction branch migration protein RuvA [Peptococcaceae bacterium]